MRLEKEREKKICEGTNKFGRLYNKPILLIE